jgi:hypothetical protein
MQVPFSKSIDESSAWDVVVDDIKVVEFGVEFHDSMKSWVHETRLYRSERSPAFKLRKDIAWNYILIHIFCHLRNQYTICCACTKRLVDVRAQLVVSHNETNT